VLGIALSRANCSEYKGLRITAHMMQANVASRDLQIAAIRSYGNSS